MTKHEQTKNGDQIEPSSIGKESIKTIKELETVYQKIPAAKKVYLTKLTNFTNLEVNFHTVAYLPGAGTLGSAPVYKGQSVEGYLNGTSRPAYFKIETDERRDQLSLTYGEKKNEEGNIHKPSQYDLKTVVLTQKNNKLQLENPQQPLTSDEKTVLENISSINKSIGNITQDISAQETKLRGETNPAEIGDKVTEMIIKTRKMFSKHESKAKKYLENKLNATEINFTPGGEEQVTYPPAATLPVYKSPLLDIYSKNKHYQIKYNERDKKLFLTYGEEKDPSMIKNIMGKVSRRYKYNNHTVTLTKTDKTPWQPQKNRALTPQDIITLHKTSQMIQKIGSTERNQY